MNYEYVCNVIITTMTAIEVDLRGICEIQFQQTGRRQKTITDALHVERVDPETRRMIIDHQVISSWC